MPVPMSPQAPLPAPSSIDDADSVRRTCAKIFALAGILQCACVALLTAWLVRDWNSEWHDKTFVDSVYLSYGGVLIYAFGKWLLTATLVFYLAAGAFLLAITAAVFRGPARPRLQSSLAIACLFIVPAGTVAGTQTLRLRRR